MGTRLRLTHPGFYNSDRPHKPGFQEKSSVDSREIDAETGFLAPRG